MTWQNIWHQRKHNRLLKNYCSGFRGNYRIRLSVLKYFERGKTVFVVLPADQKLSWQKECDTDACRDGKSRSKNSCPRSSSGVGQNFRVRHGTFRRIYLDVSSSSARGRNMRVGIKFAWKSSRFISRVRSLCIQPRHPLRASTIILA